MQGGCARQSFSWAVAKRCKYKELQILSFREAGFSSLRKNALRPIPASLFQLLGANAFCFVFHVEFGKLRVGEFQNRPLATKILPFGYVVEGVPNSFLRVSYEDGLLRFGFELIRLKPFDISVTTPNFKK